MEFYLDGNNSNGGDNLKVVKVRLRLAQAFIDMLQHAFDALLHHGVNYRTLPAYKDETLLEEARRLPLEQGHDSFIEWMRRVTKDINAAVRRKGLRQI